VPGGCEGSSNSTTSPEEMISYQISNLTQKDEEAFAAQFKQFTGTDFTDRIVLTL
jgi:hypothetical protein